MAHDEEGSEQITPFMIVNLQRIGKIREIWYGTTKTNIAIFTNPYFRAFMGHRGFFWTLYFLSASRRTFLSVVVMQQFIGRRASQPTGEVKQSVFNLITNHLQLQRLHFSLTLKNTVRTWHTYLVFQEKTRAETAEGLWRSWEWVASSSSWFRPPPVVWSSLVWELPI